MANPKKPTALRLIDGNPGKRKMPDREPIPAGDNLRGQRGYPLGLMKKARPIFKRLVNAMPADLYSSADGQAVVNFCNAASLAAQAAEVLDREGPMVTTEDGSIKQSPWAQLLRQQQEVMATWGGQLGLSPVARTRLTMPEKPKTSRFDAITGGRTNPPKPPQKKDKGA